MKRNLVSLWVISIIVCSTTLALSLPEYRDNCGCLLVCTHRYDRENAIIEGRVLTAEEEAEIPKEREACRKGCLFYHSVIHRPEHRKIPTDIERQVSQDKCKKKCNHAISEKPKRHAACIIGCEAGCLFFPKEVDGRGPRVKLTIFLEETSFQNNLLDKGDIEPVMTDPALKEQIEDTQSPTDAKPKIPSSYFTNFPVSHESEPGCGEELHLCDTWMVGEPLLCVALLILAGGLLLAAYWKQTAPSNSFLSSQMSDQAPILPEKVLLNANA